MIRFAMVLMLGLCACQPTPEPSDAALPGFAPDTGLAGYDPQLAEHAQAACAKRGGRWGQGGTGGRAVCYTDTEDAGKTCSSGSECEGLCLARSQSCAPVTPLLGCNAVLTGRGQTATLCVD